jgi:pyruvate formate lyase activating enzyme
VKILARLPLIKGVNDSPAMAEKAAKLLASLGIRAATLLPYHTLGVSKAKNAGALTYTRTFAPPEPEKITALLEIYRGQGIETDVPGAENSRN